MPKKRIRRVASKAPLTLPADFEALLGEFEKAGVEYLVIGGYAVGAHGRPRATKDIDLWIGGGPNLERVARALIAFGMAGSLADAVVAARPDEVVWFGVPPRRVDLLRTVAGIDFQGARSRAVRVQIGSLELSVIGLDDLIATKRAAGRSQDLADLGHLEAIRRDQRPDHE
jgi:hypothetical protein